MVEQPDRLEAELLRLPGDRRRPAPRVERVPAVIFADPTLGNDRADLHRFTPSIKPLHRRIRRTDTARVTVADTFSIFVLVALTAYLVLVFLIGWVAQQRGQNGALWFLLAVFTSPIVAGLLLLIITSPRRVE